MEEKLYEILNKYAAETELWNGRTFHMIEAGNFYEVVQDIVKLLAAPAVVGQSEQLVCPECSSEDPDYSRGEYHCRCCGHDWAN